MNEKLLNEVNDKDNKLIHLGRFKRKQDILENILDQELENEFFDLELENEFFDLELDVIQEKAEIY